VLIPDGESFFALPTLQCLGRVKNIKVFVQSNDPLSSIRFSRYTHQFIRVQKGQSQEEKLEGIIKIIKEKKIDLVLPIDQPTIRLLSERGEAILPFAKISPLPNVESFDIAVNKWLLAEFLKENNIPGPSTILYQTNASFDAKLSTFSFPVLIKPLKGDGGIGIKFFHDAASLTNYCKANVRSEEYLVQSFILGYDIDCSVLCQDGNILASTIQKRIINEPYFFGPTSNIDFLYDENVYNVVKEVISKLKWSGVVHFDLRYDENEKQVKVIEMNARFWGSIIGSLHAGINFPYLTVLQSFKLGFPPMNFRPIRFVDPKTAVKVFVRRMLHEKNAIQYFDYSKLNTHKRDPLPLLISESILFLKKIKHSLFKKTKPA
jgi:predicted ATP-grasp superfamily ATP-dependent carboligase